MNEMPKMKKDTNKTKRKDADDINGHKPMKGMFKEKKKIKKKKNVMAEKLSQLKNGTGKQKVKKELGKNTAKPGKKDKLNMKPQKVHFEPPIRHEPSDHVQFPCGSCGKEVNDNDEAIFCEAGCAYWYHRICTGMGNDAYALLTNEDNAEWVCDQCIAGKMIPLVRVH